MRAFLKRALPGMAASILPQAVMVAGALLASGSVGAVSWLYFANRLIELPLGIVSVAMGTVLLPTLTTAQADGDISEQGRAQGHAVELALGLSLPAAIGLAVLAHPIVEILFERGAFNASDTNQTAMLLMVLAGGLPGHALAKALAPSFFARGDVRRPALAALAGFAIALIGGWALMHIWQLTGIAMGVALSGWAAYIIMMQGSAHGLQPSRLLRILLAGAAMGMIVWLLKAGLEPVWQASAGLLARALMLAAMIGAGLLAYTIALRLLRVIGPGAAGQILRRR
jgi:putative peptidoglycan lipid II flippase